MKFKGISLNDLPNRKTELFVNVALTKQFTDDAMYDDYIEDIENTIMDLFEGTNADIYAEYVYDNLIRVRCNDITFDTEGVELLHIYHTILKAGLEETEISIGVRLDGDDWFVRKNGSEYSEDKVSLEEFLEFLEN